MSHHPKEAEVIPHISVLSPLIFLCSSTQPRQGLLQPSFTTPVVSSVRG